MSKYRFGEVQHRAIQGEALAAVESRGVRQSQWELAVLERQFEFRGSNSKEIRGRKKVGMSACLVPGSWGCILACRRRRTWMTFGCKLTTWTLALTLTKPSSIERFCMMLAMQPTLRERFEGGTPGS
jgi:hypothetical protein